MECPDKVNDSSTTDLMVVYSTLKDWCGYVQNDYGSRRI